MPIIEIVDNECMTVWFDPSHKIVSHQMHAHCSGQPFRDALYAGLEQLEKNHARKWLSDDRMNLSALSLEDIMWGELWMARAMAAGWKYWAIVLSARAAGHITQKRLRNDMAELGLTVKEFTDPAEALEWLLSVE